MTGKLRLEDRQVVLEAHTKCEHGEYAAHPLAPDQPILADGVNLCRGGSSHVATIADWVEVGRQLGAVELTDVQISIWPGGTAAGVFDRGSFLILRLPVESPIPREGEC